MGKKDPFIKFFPSDFLGGVGSLSPAERGVYITLLCLIWDGNGPITMDHGRLARRCSMPKAGFKKVLNVLIEDGKIIETPDGLTNSRANAVLQDREQRRENAKSAIKSRWLPEKEKTQQNQGQDDTGVIRAYYGGNTSPESR